MNGLKAAGGLFALTLVSALVCVGAYMALEVIATGFVITKLPFGQEAAMSWYVEEYGRAQISINLTNYKVTSMHHVIEETRKLAAERGLVVTGSEVVGLVPYPALLETGKFYLKRQSKSAGIPIKDILETAVQSLGLRDVADFNIEERVLGLPDDLNAPLVQMKVTDFIDEVSRESPAPGGGSIAALAGSLGASLTSMVSNLTANKRGSEQVDAVLEEAAEKAQQVKFKLAAAIDEDTNAFNAYMEARRLPSKTPEEKQKKFEAEQEGLKQAVNVPLNTARQSLEALKIAQTVVKYGNPNSITDVGVGALMAYNGVKGGIFNVLINLGQIQDPDFVDEMRQTCEALEKEASALRDSVIKQVEQKIK